jgi:hypothetical protein
MAVRAAIRFAERGRDREPRTYRRPPRWAPGYHLALPGDLTHMSWMG